MKKEFASLCFGILFSTVFSFPAVCPEKIYAGTDIDFDEKASFYYEKQTQEPITGKVLYYNAQGNIIAETSFKNGQADGPSKTYHANGQLRAERNYQAGKPKGLWKFYYDDGQLEEEGFYKDGKRVGQWKSYDGNGLINDVRIWSYGTLN